MWHLFWYLKVILYMYYSCVICHYWLLWLWWYYILWQQFLVKWMELNKFIFDCQHPIGLHLYPDGNYITQLQTWITLQTALMFTVLNIWPRLGAYWNAQKMLQWDHVFKNCVETCIKASFCITVEGATLPQWYWILFVFLSFVIL